MSTFRYIANCQNVDFYIADRPNVDFHIADHQNVGKITNTFQTHNRQKIVNVVHIRRLNWLV
jgi:hypothetical protein